ncbi:hypothetical protein GEMRC1_010530 [Eukaryota sp. GEM-RC1]
MFKNRSIGISRPKLYRKDTIIDLIYEHGGVHAAPGDDLSLLISSTSELSKNTKLYKQALAHSVPIVTEDWLEATISSGELEPFDKFLLESPHAVSSTECLSLSPVLTLTSLAEGILSSEQLTFLRSTCDLIFKTLQENTQLLVCSETEATKTPPLPILSSAHARGIPIVTTAWVNESFEAKNLFTFLLM